MINLAPFQPKLGSILEKTKLHSPSNVGSLLSVLTNFCIWNIVVKDAAFCFACQVFPTGPGHEKSNDVWIVEGVCQWHKMKSRGKTKQGKFPSHFGSYGHKASLEALVAFQERFQHINRMMDKEHVKLYIEAEAEKKRNREAVKILMCASWPVYIFSIYI